MKSYLPTPPPDSSFNLQKSILEDLHSLHLSTPETEQRYPNSLLESSPIKFNDDRVHANQLIRMLDML